jgi:hypothetical protein
MGAALALAIMLVVVVGVLSLAVNAQGPFQGSGPVGAASRPGRANHPGAGGPVGGGPVRAPRRPPRERTERGRDRPASTPSPQPTEADHHADDLLAGDLKRLHGEAHALVISVVDERTLGPVTRSRLTLRVEPVGGEAFEVMTRVAFPTPEHRARVKVGASIPVRFDPDDHRRVVVDMDREAGD